jgi:hypothetical protein
MTIDELIEVLEEIKEATGGEAECRFASQPSYPFEYSIRDVHASSAETRRELHEAAMEEEGLTPDEIEEWFDENEDEDEDVVYLEEGTQIGYLPSAAKELIGW